MNRFLRLDETPRTGGVFRVGFLVAIVSTTAHGQSGHPYDYSPGTPLLPLNAPYRYSQIDPNYYSTGVRTLLDWFSWADYPHSVRSVIPPPHIFDHPVSPDIPTERVHVTPSTISNQASCAPIVDRAIFEITSATTVNVTTTSSSGWSFGAVARWAIPLVRDIGVTVTYSHTSDTTWSFSDTTSVTTTHSGWYQVESCKRRRVFAVIHETHRTRDTDRFLSVVYYEGWVQLPNGDVGFDYPHYLGELDCIYGDASWIHNVTFESNGTEWIPDCDINCGGVSDGDIDNDGIPDYHDDDMDGDGITNDHDTDIDGDGTPNDSDPDDDNDGIPDGDDPSNGPAGSDDIDGDGICNEDDFDIDGDGVPNEFEADDDDDLDGDGIPNKDDADIDGDGIPNGEDDSPYGRVPTLLVWIDGEWSKVPLLSR